MAASGLHLDYSGPQVLDGGRDAPLRAVLRTDPSTSAIDPASVQFFLNQAVTGQVREIDLFDDGQHGDGEAGDGLYGGRVRVPRGLWYLGAKGELGDGSEFRRLHDIPLRVKGFAGTRSRNGQELAGTSRTIQFAITDDSSAARAQVTDQAYELGLDSSLGWATAVDLPSVATLAPGETRVFTAQVNVPADAAAGEVEETTLLVLEAGDLAASEILSVVTTVVAEKTVLLPLAIGP